MRITRIWVRNYKTEYQAGALAQAAPTLPYNVLVTRLRVCFFMPEKAEERLDNRH